MGQELAWVQFESCFFSSAECLQQALPLLLCARLQKGTTTSWDQGQSFEICRAPWCCTGTVTWVFTGRTSLHNLSLCEDVCSTQGEQEEE